MFLRLERLRNIETILFEKKQFKSEKEERQDFQETSTLENPRWGWERGRNENPDPI